MYVRLHLPCIYILLHLIIIIVINHPCKTSSYFVIEKSSSYCIIINHHSKLLVQLSYHFLILRPMYTIIPVYEGCGSLWPWHWNVASAMPDRQLTLTWCTQRHVDEIPPFGIASFSGFTSIRVSVPNSHFFFIKAKILLYTCALIS